MSWASFNVVEVMSSARFHLKSVGYLAAVQSFNQDTDVLMLTTNLLKKVRSRRTRSLKSMLKLWSCCQDLSSTPGDIAVTLDGISHIVTPDLARDLSPELIAMLNHSRAQIRKRAILVLYKIFVKYPEASQNGMDRLREKLEDTDPGKSHPERRMYRYDAERSSGVVAATVNVLCELARKNPRDYLLLAPQLFHLLTTSSNNWMLIKIIKLVSFKTL